MTNTTLITPEIIARLQTPYGGWTKAGLAALGVAWPPQKGWRKRIIGTSVPAAPLRALLADSGKPDVTVAADLCGEGTV